MTSRGAEKMTKSTIGVDISKDTLDAYRLPKEEYRQFNNDAQGFIAFIRWIGNDPVSRIVFEATGAYHRGFERAMDQADLPLVKINPRRSKRFGEAIGQLTKTDKVDAKLLALFGVMLQPQVRPAPPEIICDLKDLHIARVALVKDRAAARNRQKNMTLRVLKNLNTQRLKHIENQLAKIEVAILDLINKEPDLARRFAILTSIPGIAKCSAFTLLIEMPELGTLDSQTTASLSGTAPRVKQSGKRTGKAFVHGGRPNVRNALYMPALVACRHNPDLMTKYQALINAGKPPKVAITAIMRKLVILANALLSADRVWQKECP